MSTIVLLKTCLEAGARFSLDAEVGGVAVSGDGVLKPETYDRLEGKVSTICEILRCERRRRVHPSDIALLTANLILREYADAGI